MSYKSFWNFHSISVKLSRHQYGSPHSGQSGVLGQEHSRFWQQIFVTKSGTQSTNVVALIRLKNDMQIIRILKNNPKHTSDSEII